MRETSRSTHRISESHPNLRLAVLPGQDELSDLATTLNEVLDRLERDFEVEETLLSLARLDGRIGAVRLTRCDLGSILADLIDEMAPLGDEKSRGFVLALPDGRTAWAGAPPMAIQGDPVPVRQIFLNRPTSGSPTIR